MKFILASEKQKRDTCYDIDENRPRKQNYDRP